MTVVIECDVKPLFNSILNDPLSVEVGQSNQSIKRTIFPFRTYVYYDAHLLDTFFDGGGDINAGLIACAVVAKWTWSFTYTHPAADAQKVCICINS